MTSDSVPQEPARAAHDEAAPAPPSITSGAMAAMLARALFHQSPLSTVVYDTAGVPVAVNPAFQSFWGASLADVPAGYTVLDDPQLKATGMEPVLRRAFAGETVETPPVRYQMAAAVGTGRTIWTRAHLFPVRGDDGALMAVVLVHVDLTERVEGEEALRLEKERLRVAMEAGGAGTWEWTVGTDRVAWSEEMERIHGLAPGTFGGSFQDYRRLLHPDDAERVLAGIGPSLQGREGAQVYRIVRPDGQVRWVEAHGRLLRDEEGAPRRLLGLCTDVTERRRREEANAFLARASDLLHRSLEVEETLRAIARASVPLLGDYCLVDVLEGGSVRRVAAADPSFAGAARVPELEAYVPDLETRRSPIASVILDGEPFLEPEWTDERTRRMASGEAHAAVMEALRIRSVLSVPLAWRGARYGAITFAASEGRRHDEADLALAGELARRAAAALANSRLYAAVRVAREGVEQQALEMELQAQQLQDQATALEEQQSTLEQQVEELQALNEELEATNDELAAASEAAHQARAAAQQAEAFTRGILESITDPFVVHDAEWRFRYINTPAEAVFQGAGRGTAADLVGRVLWEEYPDLVGTRFEREMRRAATERVPVTFEEFYPRQARWSEMRCYPLPDGGLATVWKDVTERRQAEEASHYLSHASSILGSSLDYEATLTSVAGLLVPELGDWCSVQLLDEAGNAAQLAVAHADPTRVELARELNRRYPPDPRGDSTLRGVIESGVGVVIPEITDDMLEAGMRDAEHLALIRDLGLRSAIVAPLAARGRVLGAISLISAESGRRYGEADLALATEIGHRAGMAVDNARLYAGAEAARREAEQANRAKSEFLAVMSHELRTPLNAIGGYAELMEMEVHGPVTDAQRQALDRIQRSQRHLLSLINDVLNYARIEAARVSYDTGDVPVHEALAGLEALVSPQLQARRIDYRYEPCDSALSARADAEKVRQVLLNLLSNAVKFTPEGGRVRIFADADGSDVRIRVSDTGAGIPADKLEAIFEPFVQLGRGLTTPHEGTGLGLAISRDLARGMDGDLTVESEPGRGSTFTLRLPRADTAAG
jgi:PAS domain S-box-containing protein